MSPQVEEWSETLYAHDRPLVVAHSPDRRAEAAQLDRHFSALTTPLAKIHTLLRSLRRQHLLIVITTAGADERTLRSATDASILHDLLHQGVTIWGITGPRPNPVHPYCHDVLAVPTADRAILDRCHRLIVETLTHHCPPPSVALLHHGERAGQPMDESGTPNFGTGDNLKPDRAQ